MHGSHDTAAEDTHAADGQHNTPGSESPIRRLQTALEALKFQHSALTQSLSTFSYTDQGQLRSSPLLTTAKEEEEERTPSTQYSTVGRASHRLSTHSDGSVWYDAEEYDGAEEFVLDEALEDTQASRLSDNIETPSTSTSDTGDADLESNSESSDSESELFEEKPDNVDASIAITPPLASTVTRRTQLPSPPIGDEGSLFTVLKKNVGKVRTGHISLNSSSSPFRISVPWHYPCHSTSLSHCCKDW